MVSIFDVEKPRLQHVLQDINTGKIQLPNFQRDWMWDDDHIKSLLSSVSRFYPIGSIMLLKTGNEDIKNFDVRPLEGVDTTNKKPDLLILDGQQRLTALFQALYSPNPANPRKSTSSKEREDRWYYLDINKALNDDGNEIDEAILGRSEKILSEEQYQKLLFPLSDIFMYSTWRDKCSDSRNNDEKIKKILRKFEKDIIFEIFFSYEIPLLKLSSETQLEAICRIFEKINSEGVNLDVFDLLIAIYAGKGLNLREDWENKKSRIEQYRVLDNLKSSDFIKSVALLATYGRKEDRSATSCKRETILKLDIEEYKYWSEVAIKGFEDAAIILATEKIENPKFLPYNTQLIPLSAILGSLGDEAKKAGVRDNIIQWYWCGVFGESYSGTTDTKFAKDLLQVLEWIKNDGPEPEIIANANFSPSRILKLKSINGAAFKGVYALLIKEGAKDFLSGDPMSVLDYYSDIEMHHVFPRKCREMRYIDEDRRDCIVNKIPISKKANRIIGNSSPGDYIKRLSTEARMNANKTNSILESHLINHKHLRENDFESFFENRERALLKLIEDAMGKKTNEES